MEIRERIKAENDRPFEPVATPEWPSVDGEIYVRRLAGNDRDEWDAFMSRQFEKGDGDSVRWKDRTRGVRARLVTMAACDEKGEPIFNADDDKWLGEDKNAETLARIYDVARRIGGLDNRIEKDAEKNPTEPSGDVSFTGSPSA